MAYAPATKLPAQFVDSNGDPAENYVLYSFVAGTSTPTNMFTDSGGTSAGSSITLDASGYPSVSGSVVVIWLDDEVVYDLELKDSGGSTIWDAQNISVSEGGVTTVTDPWEVISRQTITSASEADVTWTAGTYDEIHVAYFGVAADTNAVDFIVRFRSSSTWQTTNYTHAGWILQNAVTPNPGAPDDFSDDSANGIQISDNQRSTTNADTSGKIRVFGPDESVYKRLTGDANYTEAGGGIQKTVFSSGCWEQTGTIDGIRFLFTSGNISSGRFIAYGLKKAQ